MLNRWNKFVKFANIAPQKPREALERMANVFEVRWDTWRSKRPACAWLSPSEGEERLMKALNFDSSAFAMELDEVGDEVDARVEHLTPNAPIRLSHCAVTSLARAAYIGCRTRKPSVVVETGVAFGMTSRYILQALDANGHGRLESVDLPPLGDEEGFFVGALVRDDLRTRWTLHRGSTRRELPPLLDRLGGVEVFVHDSLHTYRTMRWEFETVWPYMPQGSLLLSDDIGANKAFHDFADEVRPTYHWAVCDDKQNGFFGIIVK